MRAAVIAPALALLMGAAPGVYAAGDANERPPDAQAQGELVIYVFEAGTGRPLPDVELSIDGAPAPLDSDGAARLSVAAGQHGIAIPLGPERRIIDARVVAGQSTEVILTVDGQGGLWVEIEAPAGDASPQIEREEAPGVVVGRVLDDEGRPVFGARVLARGHSAQATTDSDGAFELPLPPGTWALSILKAGYQTTAAPPVLVTAEGRAELSLTLVKAGIELATVTVTAPRIEGGALELMAQRRDSSAVSDVIGAQQMSRAGDANAASALRRVTGLTLVGGRFVYVRGLGERYSSALLGRSTLPSPEPERRVVPLNLFATGQLESVTVQKTYSPDLPGEFGGGTVILTPRAYPTEALTAVSVSLGYNHGATGQAGLRGAAGPTDWLGFGRSGRDLQGDFLSLGGDAYVGQYSSAEGVGFRPEELEALGEALPNRWAMSPYTLPPNGGLSFTRGQSRPLGGGTGGYLLSLGWDRTVDLDQYWQANLVPDSDGGLEEDWRFDFEEVSERAKLGGLLTVGMETAGGARLGLTTLYSHIGEAQSRTHVGQTAEGDTATYRRIKWVEQSLALTQATGSHPLRREGHTLSWRATLSTASRYEPDRRDWRYDLEVSDPTDPSDDTYLFSSSSDSNQLFWSELRDFGQDVGVDYSLPFTQWRGLDAELTLGAAFIYKWRDGGGRRFYYSDRSKGTDPVISDEVRALPAEDLFTADYIAPEGLELLEGTRSTDAYSATQDIEAAYAKVDLPLTEALGLSGGLRLERSAQEVLTFEPFDLDPDVVPADLTTLDALPALTATWKLAEKQQLRAGYGRTLSRPDFRELSEVEYTDVSGAYALRGYKDLDRVKIDGFDLRWEAYPDEGESLSVAAFYKRFQDPIELRIEPGTTPVLMPRNSKSAQNYGIELEATRFLGDLAQPLSDVYIAGNISLIRSRIELYPEDVGILTSQTRPLQGQSPWVGNLQLGYENPDQGTTITVLFNATGPRITSLGANGAPDIYEMPSPTLDVVASQRLGRGFQLGLKGTNLLNSPIHKTQGAETTLYQLEGFSIGMSLGWSG